MSYLCLFVQGWFLFIGVLFACSLVVPRLFVPCLMVNTFLSDGLGFIDLVLLRVLGASNLCFGL